MPSLTRDQIVSRAKEMYPKCGYVYDHYPGDGVPCHMGSDGWGKAGSGPYIATDCSGYVSWCWGLGHQEWSGQFGPDGAFGRGHFVYREGASGNVEADFPGIEPGDIFWRDGHVGIYIGNGESMEASTGHWSKTASQRGMVHGAVKSSKWKGFCSYDKEFSLNYNPDEDGNVNNWNPHGGPNNPAQWPWLDDEGLYDAYLSLEDRYTKRYKLMKAWRKVK